MMADPALNDGEAVLARREEILDAATELFAEHGFSDTMTQTLAERLQIGKGTIYRHFPSKQALFLAAADRGIRLLQEESQREASKGRDPFDRIIRATHAYLRYFDRHPEFVELIVDAAPVAK